MINSRSEHVLTGRKRLRGTFTPSKQIKEIYVTLVQMKIPLNTETAYQLLFKPLFKLLQVWDGMFWLKNIFHNKQLFPRKNEKIIDIF